MPFLHTPDELQTVSTHNDCIKLHFEAGRKLTNRPQTVYYNRPSRHGDMVRVPPSPDSPSEKAAGSSSTEAHDERPPSEAIAPFVRPWPGARPNCSAASGASANPVSAWTFDGEETNTPCLLHAVLRL